MSAVDGEAAERGSIAIADWGGINMAECRERGCSLRRRRCFIIYRLPSTSGIFEIVNPPYFWSLWLFEL